MLKLNQCAKGCMLIYSFHSLDGVGWGSGGLPPGNSFRHILSETSGNVPLQDRRFAKTSLDCHSKASRHFKSVKVIALFLEHQVETFFIPNKNFFTTLFSNRIMVYLFATISD